MEVALQKKLLLTSFIAPFLILAGCSSRRPPIAIIQSELELTNAPAIHEPRVSTVRVGDWLNTWMSFKCDAASYSNICRQGFSDQKVGPLNAGAIDLPSMNSNNPNAPGWWPSNALHSDIFYKQRAGGQGPPFNNSYSAYMWRDPATSTVFAYSAVWH